MRLKILYLLAALTAGTLFFGAMSVNVPIPPREQYQCQQEAKTYANIQPADCPASETIWKKSLKDPVAYYTAWLTLFTLALAAVGIAQSFLTDQQIRLARKEFAITHRPKMRVRSVRGPDPWDDEKSEVMVILANVGNSPATVVFDTIDVIIQDEDLTKIGLRSEPLPPGGRRIEVGQRYPLFRFTEKAWTGFDTAFTDQHTIVGHVAYDDDAGVRRITSFARDYNRGTRRFSVSEFFPEDDYED